ncbi:MAG: integrase arm-type DNA-binding domain-containing protein [Methylococcaceae bacterium]|jgi:hypothetical protein
MSLSDTAIKSAKPKPDKAYKMPDERGMYLLVHKNGSKYFRFDYSFLGKRKTLALGVYPDTSLKQARVRRDQARSLIADGIDPSDLRKEENAAKKKVIENKKRLDSGLPALNSFEDVTRKWLSSNEGSLIPISNKNKTRHFEIHVFPAIGAMPIKEVKPSHISNVINPLKEKRQIPTAKRVLAEISAAFDYAIAHGYCDFDPAHSIKKQIPANKEKHRAATYRAYGSWATIA